MRRAEAESPSKDRKGRARIARQDDPERLAERRGLRPRRLSSASLRLDVFQHLFAAVAEEMGAALLRSSFSTNVRERRDFSCALFDARGAMIGQAAHLPVHLGSAPLSVQAAIASVPMGPGDAVLLNDPYRGGTHLPDLTLVSPVHLPGRRAPDFYVANRAHHADVGGPVPGSMAGADDVHGEGLCLPPIHLVRAGRIERELLALLRANMRAPDEREGDLLAQWATNRIGAERLLALVAEHGAAEVRRRAGELMDWTERLTRALLRSLPARTVRHEDALEQGDELVPIRLALARRGDRLVCDFRASGRAPRSSLNATRAVTQAAVFYCLRTLLPPGTPANDGILRPVRLLTTPGTVVDAAYPAGVSAGNVETSQRLVDVLFGALSRLLPQRVPAASAGTMSNFTFGTTGVTYYETLPGGAGASARGAGASAVQTHMTNTRNTPIEAFERLYPVRVERLELVAGSGGAGRHRGGDGLRKRLRFLAPVQAGFVGDRQRTRPYGLQGGGPGRPGRLRLRRPGARTWEALPARWTAHVADGCELEIETPGGGGFGRARR